MTLPKGVASRAGEFFGRAWVFQELDNWLAQPPDNRYFLLTGEPGSGKTAIAARLYQYSTGEYPAHPYPHLGQHSIGAAHFCIAGDANSVDPRSFASGLALQLSARSQDYAQALKNVGDKVININVQATSQKLENFTGVVIQNLDVSRMSAQDAFNRVVLDPLLEVNQPFNILVDSLDEALTHAGDVNIVKLLSNLAGLPVGVRFVLTSRVDSRVEGRFPTADGTFLSAPEHNAQNYHDIVEFAKLRFNAAGLTNAALPTLIADKADGNFQYAQFIIRAIVNKTMDPSTLDGLPPGLDAIYHESLTRVVDLGGKSWARDYAPVMGVLSVAHEPRTLCELQTFSAQSETTVWNCITDLQQFIESGAGADPRYSVYHHSVTEFFQRRTIPFPTRCLNNTFYLPAAEWHRRVASLYVGAAPPHCWDLYGLSYVVSHLSQAARASTGAERHSATQALVQVTTDPEFRAEHLARVSNLPQLQRDLEQAERTAACDPVPEALPLIVESALSLLLFRRQELRPEPLFDLALRGEPESAEARLLLFDVDNEWHQIAAILMAWLSVDVCPPKASALRDRVSTMEPFSTRAARLMEFFDAAVGAGSVPHRDPLPSPLPLAVVRAIVERMGGSGAIHSVELLASHNIPQVRNPNMRAMEGYLSQHDGPSLVSFAQADPVDGDELLREYIEIHTGYQYVQYRNRSLGFLLDAVCNHYDPHWIRTQAVRIVNSALAGSRSDFQEALLTAVLAVRAPSDAAAASQLDAMLHAAADTAAELVAERRSDPLSRAKRWIAATLEAFQMQTPPRPVADFELLIESARKILRVGFAGYSSPACLTLAEAIEIAADPTPGALQHVLDNALSAAHNVQDPLYCARLTSRVHAMRDLWWQPAPPFDVESTIERFTKDPEAAEFSPHFHIGERFQYRSPESLQMDPAFTNSNTLEQLEEAFRLRHGDLTAFNPGVDRDAPLADQFAVRLPDAGFSTWLAARFSARVIADRTLPRAQRIAMLRSMVAIAASNPTTLDTVLARLVLVEQPAAAQTLDRIAALAQSAMEPQSSMSASLPDAALPA